MRFKASGRAALIVAAAMCIGFSAPSQAQQATGQTQTATQQQQPVALGKPLKLNKYAKHRSRHSRRHATRHSRKHTRAAKRHEDRKVEEAAAEKHDARHDNKAEDTKVNTAEAAKDTDKTNDAGKTTEPGKAAAANPPSPLSASVANARAQLLNPTASGTPAPMLSTRDVPSPTIGLATPASDTASNETPAASPPSASNVVAADELNEIDRSAGDAKEQAPPAVGASTLANPTLANPTLAMASLNTPDASAGESGSASASTWAQTSLIGKFFIAFGGLLTLASAARMFIA